MKKEISIIGVPMDLGQSRRGVDMGPRAIRYAGILERLEKLNYVVHELGDIDIPRPDVGKNLVTEVNILRNLHEVAITNERLAIKVAQQVELGRFPLVLGGDHSIAIGTLAGVSHHYENLGLIWYDAHGDINTEET